MQRCRVQFRCSGRLPEVQRGFSECRVRGDQEARREIRRQKCREKGTLWLAVEPGRMQEQERAVNKAAQAPLVPRDGGQGHGLGFPQGRDGPKTAPNRKESLGMQGRTPHLYTVGEERERQTGKETGRDKEIGRTDRREQGKGLVKLPLSTLPLLPFLSPTDPHSPPKLMTQEAMMMRTPPTSATMLKSLATRPRR